MSHVTIENVASTWRLSAWYHSEHSPITHNSLLRWQRKCDSHTLSMRFLSACFFLNKSLQICLEKYSVTALRLFETYCLTRTLDVYHNSCLIIIQMIAINEKKNFLEVAVCYIKGIILMSSTRDRFSILPIQAFV